MSGRWVGCRVWIHPKKYMIPKVTAFPSSKLLHSFLNLFILSHQILSIYCLRFPFMLLKCLQKTKHTRTPVLNFSTFITLLALLPLFSFRAKMKRKLFLSHRTGKHGLPGVGFKMRNTRACSEARVCACVRCGQPVSRSFAWWRRGRTWWPDAGWLSAALVLTKELIVALKGNAYKEIK